MIYIGVTSFLKDSGLTAKMNEVLNLYSDGNLIKIKKNKFTIFVTKISKIKDQDYFLQNDSSLLIGRAFCKNNNQNLSEKCFKAINLDNNDFINNIWGKYIYIQDNKNLSHISVVIDNTGQLPFFFYFLPQGEIIFSSHIELISKLIDNKLTYNWEYLKNYLVLGVKSSNLTPFNEVFELPHACSVDLSINNADIKPSWNPLLYYKNYKYNSNNAAEVLKSSLKSWISPYKNVCLSLSGGLDSASIAYCLKSIVSKDQNLSAINFYHSTIATSNERVHARNVCQETGINLREIDVSEALPFDYTQKKPRFAPNKPFPGLISIKWLELVSDSLPLEDSCVFINGHGGDQIFMRPPSKNSIVDYIIENGLKGVSKHIKDMTYFFKDSYFSISKECLYSTLLYAYKNLIRVKSFKTYNKNVPDWFESNLFEGNNKNFPNHPIYDILPNSVIPGKADQIEALYDAYAALYMEMNNVNPPFYPFLYSPIVEFSLSYPTYKHFEDGYDRYLLRKSISNTYNTKSVWRRDKSQTTGLFQLGLKNNKDRVLDLCKHGKFAKKNLINIDKLSYSIMRISSGDTKDMWFFSQLASCEIFFEYWNNIIGNKD